jgi:hypothetical protein
MVALGGFFLLYAIKPGLPVVRSLPYLWRGNLPPSLESRIALAALGAVWLGVAVLIGAAHR